MSEDDRQAAAQAPAADEPQRKKGKHRKDKPWDTDDIDHWKIPQIAPEDIKAPFTEESSFATLFPKYREKYLKDNWIEVTRKLNDHGIDCELNLVEGSMTVKTTAKTYDPYIIIKARDLIKLLSRGVNLPQAEKILQDGMWCDIIKIGSMVRNKERFVKRRQRLVGPNGATLKAIELLTECYVLVQGKTVCAIGPVKGIKNVRRIIVDCMNNIHPVYNIKALMIKKELAKDPAMAGENWDKFIPQFKKLSKPKKKEEPEKKKKKDDKDKDEAGSEGEGDDKAAPKKQQQQQKKKPYTPFPPPQQPRKEDIQMETGEYFLSKREKREREEEKMRASNAEKEAEKQREKMKKYVAPAEAAPTEHRLRAAAPQASLEELKQKLISAEKRKRSQAQSSEASDYVAQGAPAKKRRT
eukprot:m51a1_g2624 putative ribosomal rna assembly protein mis3 (411) ;mRNA; f:545417-547055